MTSTPLILLLLFIIIYIYTISAINIKVDNFNRESFSLLTFRSVMACASAAAAYKKGKHENWMHHFS